VTSPGHLTRLDGFAPLSAASAPSLVLSAGAVLPPEAARRARDILGVPVTEIFGSTETGAFATRVSSGGEAPWEALDDVQLAVAENGTLRVRAPHVAGASGMALNDRVELLDARRFRFHGRSDRIVKLEGKRVSLIEVEAALTVLPWVAASRAVVLDHVGPTM